MIATATAAPLLITQFNADHLALALEVVAKANRRAERAGITGRFTTAHSTATVVTEATAGWDTEVEDITTFVVLGEPLVLAGWEFVATITWDSETGLAVTRVVPGVEVDLSAHRDAQVCQHCNVRRQRNDTYVVREQATGATLQVGSTCLAAFLGIDPTSALWCVGEVFTAQDFDNAPRVEPRVGTAWVLAITSEVISRHGWISATAAGYNGSSTKGRVLDVLFPPTGRGTEAIRAEAADIKAAVLADDTARNRADATLAYVLSEDFSGTSEYVVNLKAALTGTSVSTRNLGLAVSAISAYTRHLEGVTKKAVAATRAPSQHVGVVGGKVTLEVTLESVRYFDGAYGTTTLLSFVTDEGVVAKWFASGTKDIEPGARFTVTGTVKKHDAYNGQPQTVLTRCKLA